MEKPEYRIIPLDQLKLDPNNPRLPKSLQGKSEKEILEYMLLDASLIELMLAIGKNDFFPGEQLLVVLDSDEKFKVVEGNRRLSALKLLSNPGLAEVQKAKVNQVIDETEFRPDEIPCLVFSKEEDIYNYLGYRHITGIKEWKLLEKAKYLYDLWQTSSFELSLNLASRELAKSIGSRKDYVKRLLVGYQIYKMIEDEKFFKIKDLDDTSFYFNYIADSLSRANICEFLGVDLTDDRDDYSTSINLGNLKKWIHWLFEKNDQNRTRLIGDSESLTVLNRVIGHPVAFKAFDQEGVSLEVARELTGELDQQFMNSIHSALNALEHADRLVIKVTITEAEVIEYVKNIRSLATKIARTLQDREDEKDEL
ncbi:hypothetical protein Belba_0948 [Belliella baltica DSM 15883]|uniref:ParB/Sulfiredoxin domain-containing protein n=1 Tax=Belliella baltica (strain DSM 15883 / CIP 108006 / LMG 21964 / BA134) TaxID=866536 RepID=I3Z2X3_BELBD|nr:hypothetical protein [Belliella baltica]AFL83591.1 hypothetical protein Belba_0948 [Belliella baltica DSM 15883]